VKLLLTLSFFVVVSIGLSQKYVLKWDKQSIQMTLFDKPMYIEEDTVNEIDYFEYVDDDYDFAFEMIEKGHDDFEYIKDLYEFALKEIEKEDGYDSESWKIGKLEGLNSFYAISEEEDKDSKTGATYKYVIAELVFYSEDKKKLFYFDIEYDNVPITRVEAMVKSIKFY
jgi:hypothetical protein